MPDCGKTTNLAEFIRESEAERPSCPYCQSERLSRDPETGKVLCEKGHLVPPRPSKQTIEALRALSGKGTPKSQLKKRKEKVEIKERPEGPDFHWFVQDVARAAKRHGYIGMIDPSSYPNNREAWVHSIGRYNLDLEQLQKDWGAYLRDKESGDKEIGEVGSAAYCLNNLLLDPGSIVNMTEVNAQALSAALRGELPKERKKYLGQRQDRYAEIEAIVNTQEIVDYKTAAKYLAQFLRLGTCSSRYIGKLSRPEGPLNRVGRGRIETVSLREYKRKLLQK